MTVSANGSTRNGSSLGGDRRRDSSTSRTDELHPFGEHRRRGSVQDVTKGGYIHDDGNTSLWRWAAALGGDPDLSRPYLQHPWVYACVAAIGRAASSVPVRLQRKMSNGAFETVEKTPLSNLLGYPNPLQSQRKFFRAVCTSQQLYGETFLLLLKKGPDGNLVPVPAVGGTRGMTAMIEPPDEIWPVRGDQADAELDPVSKLPSAWVFATPGGRITYPAHAVVQLAEVNPYSPLRGAGPMAAAYRTAAKDFVIDRYDEALLQNGGSPGGVLSVDGPLTDSDQRAIREAWHEAQGRPEAHRKTAVLPKGTTYKEIGMSPQQMEHESLRDWDRQTILSIFGVPPVILGLETINYAPAKEQHRIFWDTTIIPYLDFVTDELQHKLLGRRRGPDSELVIDFDISGVAALREDMDSKVDRALKLYEKGNRSFEEAARLAGWDITEHDLEGTDERWVLSNMIPAAAGVSLADAERQADPEGVKEASGPNAEGSVDPAEATHRTSGHEAVAEPLWPPHLDTEAKRLEWWKRYTAQEDEVIAKVTKKTVRVYRDLLLYVRKRLRKIAKSSSAASAPAGVMKWVPTEAEIDRMLELNRLQWSELLAAGIVPVLKESMVKAAAGLAGELAAPPIISGITDPFIIDFYKGFPMKLAEGATSTLADDVRKTILRVFAEADVSAAPSLRDAIRLTLKEQEAAVTHMIDNLEARAARIARTETVSANNGARMKEMMNHGVEENVWSTSGQNVRPEHQRMEGERARVGEYFSNGCRWPGDPAGSARQTVNCHCVTYAVPQPQTNQ